MVQLFISTGWTIFVCRVSLWKARKSQHSASYLFLLLCHRHHGVIKWQRGTLFWHAMRWNKKRVGKPFFNILACSFFSVRRKHIKMTHVRMGWSEQCVMLRSDFLRPDSLHSAAVVSIKFHKCPCYDLTFQTFYSLVLLPIRCLHASSTPICVSFHQVKTLIRIACNGKRRPIKPYHCQVEKMWKMLLVFHLAALI